MTINLTPGTALDAFADGKWLGVAHIEANEGTGLTIVLFTGSQKTTYRLPKDKLNGDRSFHLEDCVVLRKELVQSWTERP